MKCAECKEREAAWEWPCIIVSHSQQEKDLGTQTQIKMHQTVLGLDNAGLCEECEKNHAKKEIQRASGKRKPCCA